MINGLPKSLYKLVKQTPVENVTIQSLYTVLLCITGKEDIAMTAGSAFIIGLIFCDAKIIIIGNRCKDIKMNIENVFPEFFKELPVGYESYISRADTTNLMIYLYYAARAGSIVHMRAFMNLFPAFVEKVYVDDRDLDLLARSNYDVVAYDDLPIKSRFFTADDQRRYLNKVFPMSERY